MVLFQVEVNQPNGMVDEEPRNKANSRFHRVPTWSYPDLDDNRIIVWTKTNQVAWETSKLELLDAAGNVVWERGYPTANTTFKDTLSLNQVATDSLSTMWAMTVRASGLTATVPGTRA